MLPSLALWLRPHRRKVSRRPATSRQACWVESTDGAGDSDDAAASGGHCGWHESSYELLRGLMVLEHQWADAAGPGAPAGVLEFG